MLSTIQGWVTQLQINYEEYADPRTKNMFLMDKPGTVAIIIISYLYFCLKAGPAFMKDRKPFELKKTLILYNFIQVLISCYITYEGAKIWSHFNFFCEPLDYSTRPLMMKGMFICWCYFMAKITELLDTVFFVLRKKYNQVSFLHLFHHTVMPTFSWLGVRYFAGGHGSLFGVINSFVHIIMYSYYLIAGLGPEYQKYLWWKRHVTDLQLIQFVIVFLHNIFPLFTSCAYPKSLHLLILMFAGTFIYMFGNFYIQTYLKNKRTSKTDNLKNGKIKSK